MPALGLRSIKLVVSDLHLGEGDRWADGSYNYFEDFHEDKRFAAFLEYYDAQYPEIPIELVINGDLFDFLRRERLGRYPDVMFESLAVQIVTAAIEAHREVFEALQRFLKKEKNRVICVIGESDCGLFWEKVQRVLVEKVSSRIKIASEYHISDGIYFEHGHAVEALSRFPAERFQLDPSSKIKVLNLPWAAYFISDYIVPLRRITPHLGMVRPLYAYFVWMVLFDFVFAVRMLGRLIAVFLRNRLIMRGPGYGLLRSIQVVKEFFLQKEDLASYALRIFGRHNVRMVFLGHSHLATYRYFRGKREYFNTGSWTRTVSLDVNHIGARVMLTFGFVEVLDDGGVRAELLEWKGAHAPVVEFA